MYRHANEDTVGDKYLQGSVNVQYESRHPFLDTRSKSQCVLLFVLYVFITIILSYLIVMKYSCWHSRDGCLSWCGVFIHLLWKCSK